MKAFWYVGAGIILGVGISAAVAHDASECPVCPPPCPTEAPAAPMEMSTEQRAEIMQALDAVYATSVDPAAPAVPTPEPAPE